MLSDAREEKVHKFLKNHQQGGRLPCKGKPIKKTFLDSDLQKYCITFSKHGDYYNYSKESTSEFLPVFENNFVPMRNFRTRKFKCSVTIINHQPPPMSEFVEVTDARIRVTNV